MLHDLANDDVTMLHSNGQLTTDRNGDTEKGCQKPAPQHKTTGDMYLCIAVLPLRCNKEIITMMMMIFRCSNIALHDPHSIG